jgi:hypothetical protein
MENNKNSANIFLLENLVVFLNLLINEVSSDKNKKLKQQYELPDI